MLLFRWDSNSELLNSQVMGSNPSEGMNIFMSEKCPFFLLCNGRWHVSTCNTMHSSHTSTYYRECHLEISHFPGHFSILIFFHFSPFVKELGQHCLSSPEKPPRKERWCEKSFLQFQFEKKEKKLFWREVVLDKKYHISRVMAHCAKLPFLS